MVVQCYAEDAEGLTDGPQKPWRSGGWWEGIVSPKLEDLAENMKEVKSDLVVIKKEIAAIKANIRDLKVAMGKEIGDLKVVNVAIFFVLVLLLVLNGGVEIGDVVRLANPL
jgi:hypothetical protein